VKFLTETGEVKTETQIEEKKEEKPKLRVFPEICAFTDKEGTGYDIEILLPGVEKDSIKLKMNKDYITINGESDNLIYSGSYQLCCPVEPDKAKSTYKEGLLRIHVPFKEIELHTVNVEVE
jgi:HSP20 family molecular chaperone IbpA